MMRDLIANIPTEAKGVAGWVASVSLSDLSSVASIAAAVATAVYMGRKAWLLRKPIAADCPQCSATN